MFLFLCQFVVHVPIGLIQSSTGELGLRSHNCLHVVHFWTFVCIIAIVSLSLWAELCTCRFVCIFVHLGAPWWTCTEIGWHFLCSEHIWTFFEMLFGCWDDVVQRSNHSCEVRFPYLTFSLILPHLRFVHASTCFNDNSYWTPVVEVVDVWITELRLWRWLLHHTLLCNEITSVLELHIQCSIWGNRCFVDELTILHGNTQMDRVY